MKLDKIKSLEDRIGHLVYQAKIEANAEKISVYETTIATLSKQYFKLTGNYYRSEK